MTGEPRNGMRSWFTEGFDTPEMVEAKRLIDTSAFDHRDGGCLANHLGLCWIRGDANGGGPVEYTCYGR
jgi:hypothetical protein